MKIIFSLLFIMVAAFASTGVMAQAKISDDLVISERALGQVKTIDNAIDWQSAIKDETLRFPYRKRAMVADQNWMLASVAFGGDYPVLVGRKTDGSDMFVTKVFGIITKVEQVDKPSPQRHVNIFYRAITAKDEQTKIINRLASDGRYGSKSRHYTFGE